MGLARSIGIPVHGAPTSLIPVSQKGGIAGDGEMRAHAAANWPGCVMLCVVST